MKAIHVPESARETLRRAQIHQQDIGLAGELLPVSLPVQGFVLQASNAKVCRSKPLRMKTGEWLPMTRPVATTYSGISTCDVRCPMLIGRSCYAVNGRYGILMRRIDAGEVKAALPFDQFCRQLTSLPDGYLVRLKAAGGWSSVLEFILTAAAVRHLVAWSYGHTPKGDAAWLEQILRENRATTERGSGLVLNISADTIAEAVEYYNAGHSVTVTVPQDMPAKGELAPGVPYVQCPAQRKLETTCATCLGDGVPLCARNRVKGQRGGVVVAFAPEGMGHIKVAQNRRLTVLN